MLNKKVEYTLVIDEKQIQVLIESLYLYVVTKNNAALKDMYYKIAQELREDLIKGK